MVLGYDWIVEAKCGNKMTKMIAGIGRTLPVPEVMGTMTTCTGATGGGSTSPVENQGGRERRVGRVANSVN